VNKLERPEAAQEIL